jgi:XTP/dITP diphosphohydrolase
MMMKIYFITSNKGKFKEVEEKLGTIAGIELERMELEYPEVQADKLEDVVLFGMDWLNLNGGPELSDHAVMIEDSGLFVDRLKGFPGVYSAFVHRTIGGFEAVLSLMEGDWDRRAHFETCIGFSVKGGMPRTFTGRCDGTLSKEAQGEHGFGYDPIFIPEGENRTFAEMETAEKNIFSHRSKAVKELKKYLLEIK